MKHQERLNPLQLKAEEYTFEYFYDPKAGSNEAGAGLHAPKDKPFVSPYLEIDKDENIIINYPAIDPTGIQLYEIDRGKTRGDQAQYFSRKRLAHPLGDMKYFQPAKTGTRIFYPKNTLQKIRKAEELPVLYMVEGEFKSIYGDHYGLDIIGLGGINNFIEGKSQKTFHPDILQIIKTCKVRKLVLLGDADSRMIKFDPEKDAKKDLAKRLYAFYGACKNMREAAAGMEELDLYFMHIKDDFYTSAKGLDDLYAYVDEHTKDLVTKDLQLLIKATTYFAGIDLTLKSTRQIKQYFYLELAKGGAPESFYNRFQNTLDTQEFVFNKAVWKWDDGSGLVMVKHADSFEYARIGVSYVKNIRVKNSKGMFERRLEPWAKGEIVQDYVKEKGIPNFLYMVPKYDAFCNVPFNDPDEYQQVIEDCYNLYYKVEHTPEKGNWPTIDTYLKHLFQNAYQDKYDLMLDYFALSYRDPNQKLPIVVLASRERETGKSTLLWLLTEMYGENAAVIGNDELTDKYNDDYASKLFIGVDEGFIDKKHVLEKIKSWSTSPYINLSTKFKSRQRISFFAKLIITTNDETDFIKIDGEETRFLVCKVPALAAEDKDPDLLDKMKEEIPAFLYFLKHRELKYPKVTRHWFAVDALETDALKKLKSFSKMAIEKELEIHMREKFMMYKESPLCLALKEIYEELNNAHSRRPYDKPYIQKILEERMTPAIPYVAKGRYDYLKQIPVYEEGNSQGGSTMEGARQIAGYEVIRHKMQNKYYKFYAERFLTAEEIKEYEIENVEPGKEKDKVVTQPGQLKDLPF